jgi:hypothetical protein
MRSLRLLVWVLSVSLVGFLGCGKATPQAGGKTAQVDELDASKFRPAFEAAPPETQSQVNQIMLSIGSSDYVTALSQIESLTNAPGLTEPQKQVTADLSQQLQKKLASAAAAQNQ